MRQEQPAGEAFGGEVVVDLPGKLMSALADEVSRDQFDIVIEGALRAPGRFTNDYIAEAARLYDVLDRYRGRLRELTALYDTASDLSGMDEVQPVLNAIIHRSRRLLQTDASYLMLLDDQRGDAYMRATDGTVSSRFMSIRLPLGVGLGGVVAETGQAEWTENYLTDGRYRHAIDEIVREEALVAILGVPLKASGRTIGILFTAERHPRVFMQEEIALLSSLAALAAVALERARQFQQTRDAVDSLTAANESIQRQHVALERAASVHERLTRLVLAGGSIADVAEAVGASLGGAVTVLDPSGLVVTQVPESRESASGHFKAETAVGLEALVETVHRERRTMSVTLEGAQSWVVPVVAGSENLGTVIFQREGMSGLDLRNLERAVMAMALLGLNQRAQDNAANQLRGDLLMELLGASNLDTSELHRRAELLGARLRGPTCSAVLLGGAETLPPALLRRAASFAGTAFGLATPNGNRLLFVLPGSDPSVVARRLVAELGPLSGQGFTIGAAGPIDDLRNAKEWIEQAARCAQALRALGRGGEGTTPAELGVLGLLLSEAGRKTVSAFVAEALGPLEAYDLAHDTALVPTLQAYLRSDGSPSRTATTLYIHVNTLYQRLERVDHVLGADWRSPDGRLALTLAFRFGTLFAL